MPNSPDLLMLRDKLRAFAAERDWDQFHSPKNLSMALMVEAAELMSEMLKARKELNLSAVVGDDASAKLVEALAALGQARSAVVSVHNELNDVKLRIGVRTKMLGFEDKPAQRPAGQAADLREVG